MSDFEEQSDFEDSDAEELPSISRPRVRCRSCREFHDAVLCKRCRAILTAEVAQLAIRNKGQWAIRERALCWIATQQESLAGRADVLICCSTSCAGAFIAGQPGAPTSSSFATAGLPATSGSGRKRPSEGFSDDTTARPSKRAKPEVIPTVEEALSDPEDCAELESVSGTKEDEDDSFVSSSGFDVFDFFDGEDVSDLGSADEEESEYADAADHQDEDGDIPLADENKHKRQQSSPNGNSSRKRKRPHHQQGTQLNASPSGKHETKDPSKATGHAEAAGSHTSNSRPRKRAKTEEGAVLIRRPTGKSVAAKSGPLKHNSGLIQCAGCKTSKPTQDFSKAQLKKRGKKPPRCKTCLGHDL